MMHILLFGDMWINVFFYIILKTTTAQSTLTFFARLDTLQIFVFYSYFHSYFTYPQAIVVVNAFLLLAKQCLIK